MSRPGRGCSPPKAPTMSLDDGPADGQPHAEPVALGGVKRLKDLLEILAAHPRAAVAYHDTHHVRPFHCRSHIDLALVRRTILHGFESVKQQVKYNLLQLHLVASHRRQARIKFQRNTSIVQDRVTVDQQNDITDDVR